MQGYICSFEVTCGFEDTGIGLEFAGSGKEGFELVGDGGKVLSDAACFFLVEDGGEGGGAGVVGGVGVSGCDGEEVFFDAGNGRLDDPAHFPFVVEYNAIGDAENIAASFFMSGALFIGGICIADHDHPDIGAGYFAVVEEFEEAGYFALAVAAPGTHEEEEAASFEKRFEAVGNDGIDMVFIIVFYKPCIIR